MNLRKKLSANMSCEEKETVQRYGLLTCFYRRTKIARDSGNSLHPIVPDTQQTKYEGQKIREIFVNRL